MAHTLATGAGETQDESVNLCSVKTHGSESELCTEAFWEPFGRQNTDKHKLQQTEFILCGADI